MSEKRKTLAELPEEIVEFNRERYKMEMAHAIFITMTQKMIPRAELARLLGVQKSRVTQILSGDANLAAESFADALLALGRAAHVAIGDDSTQLRLPLEHGQAEEQRTAHTDVNWDCILSQEFSESTSDVKPKQTARGTNVQRWRSQSGTASTQTRENWR